MAKCASPMRATTLLSISFCFLSSVLACGGTADQTDAGDDAAAAVDSGDQPEADVADAAPDVDNGQQSTTYPAFKVDPPQVVSGGGSVLATPKVVPVYFANDDTTFTGKITTFLNKLPGSTYWGPGETEYGVGAVSIATPVQLTEDAPASIADADIQTWLGAKLTSNDPAWPANDANTVYVLFYPSATTAITLGQGGGTSCQDFGGYHDNITIQTTNHVAYAVVPRCANFGGLSGLDAISATATHEIVEASTDPYPQSTPAYGQVDDNHIIWMFLLGGGEVGDMCAQSASGYYTPTDVGSVVARIWSNAKAKAGHDPCQPDDGTPYFNSMPVLTDSVNVAGQVTTKAVTIPVGTTKDVEVDLFSDAATSGDWTVSAIDSATLQGQPAELAFAWDKTSGRNGNKLHLSITVNKASQYNAEGFLIESKLGGRTNVWIGLVSN